VKSVECVERKGDLVMCMRLSIPVIDRSSCNFRAVGTIPDLHFVTDLVEKTIVIYRFECRLGGLMYPGLTDLPRSCKVISRKISL
jgi:hypothetical protein